MFSARKDRLAMSAPFDHGSDRLLGLLHGHYAPIFPVMIEDQPPTGGAAPHNHLNGQDDLPSGVSAATQLQRLFGLHKWKHCLNEWPELAVVDQLCDIG